MLRIYFLQQWYGLSDPGAEEALYDMHSMRDFAGLDLGRDAIPPSRGLRANPCRAVDETTILYFRHLLERHNLTEALFAEVSAYLEEHALKLRGGTIMWAQRSYLVAMRRQSFRRPNMFSTLCLCLYMVLSKLTPYFRFLLGGMHGQIPLPVKPSRNQ